MRRQLHVVNGGVVDAVVGYRSWEGYAVNGEVHLTSISRREVEWPRDGPLRAECFCGGCTYRFPYASVERGEIHACGVYAWANPVIPASPRYLSRSPFYPSWYLAGEVLLWGKVRVHSRGFRAEYAEMSCFYVCDAMDDRQRTRAELSALQYGVPTVLVDPATWSIDEFRRPIDLRNLGSLYQ